MNGFDVVTLPDLIVVTVPLPVVLHAPRVSARKTARAP